jgi:hypothetical protein
MASSLLQPRSAPLAEPILWTEREVARRLRVSIRTMHSLRAQGLRFLRLGGVRAIRYRPGDVEAFVAARVEGGTA